MRHPHHWAALLSSFLLMEARYGGKVQQKKERGKKKQSELVIRALCDLVHKINRLATESWWAANLWQVI